MDRRGFMSTGIATAAVGGFALSAKPAKAAPTPLTVKGYLKRVTNNMYVITPTAQMTDPKSPRYADWPKGAIRVYAKDTTKMKVGLVTIKGKVTIGNQIDANTRTAATMLMIDAVMA